MFTKVY